MKFWEDIAVGERAEIGRYAFTTDNIKGFARRFDPQPFHLDEAAAYATEIVELRPSASRPEWGIMTSRNTGTNQRGEPVLTFISSAFVERKAMRS